MRICWIKAGGLVPGDFGGRIRSYHMVKALAKRHPVTFATFYRRVQDDQHPSLNEIFEKLVLIPMDLPEGKSLGDFILYGKTILSGLPHSMQKYYSAEVRRGIGRLLSENKFDAVICDFMTPAALLDWNMPARTILFTHNVEAEIWQRQATVARSVLWKTAAQLEYQAMSRAEAKYCRLADHVVAVSNLNRDFFAQYVPPDRLTAVSTGVDTDYFQPQWEQQQPGHVVFTGSYDWEPNSDAMHWYFDEILPLIRKDVPKVETWAVGKSPTAAMKRMAESDPRFHVTGRVEDVRPYMHKGSVYIVPMRSGSGTRLKVFEALSCGKAMVSTPTGAEGLPVKDAESVMLAATAEEFAAKTIRLLKNAPLRQAIGRAARELVIGRYSWDKVGEEFDDIVQRTVAMPKRNVAG
jgi:glycosyltransferase involved in cell wall biosynthesis